MLKSWKFKNYEMATILNFTVQLEKQILGDQLDA